MIPVNSQSKQEAVLFEIQFLINETKNAIFNLHKWTQPEKVRLSTEVNYNNLHLPIANLSKFNKGALISGIKVFNHLPQCIKALTNDH